MLLSCEPLVVTDFEVATLACNELAACIELGVDEVADGVAIAAAASILDDEATGSTLDLRGSHQLCLCYAVHRQANLSLEEALVRELCNGGKNLLVLVATAQGNDTDRSKVRECTLVARPLCTRVNLLSQVLTESDGELALHEGHEVECSVVNSHVRDGHGQTATANGRSDVGKVQHLIAQCLYLTDLFHLNVVDADRPNLVTSYAGDETQTLGQTQTLVESRNQLVDGQIDGTRGGDVRGTARSNRPQRDFTLVATVAQHLTQLGVLVLVLTNLGQLCVGAQILDLLTYPVSLLRELAPLCLLLGRKFAFCHLFHNLKNLNC